MRTERERRAAAIRALFVELWESGLTSAPEMAMRMEQSRRNVERLIQQYRCGEMAEKIARDKVLEAAEAGGAPPPAAMPAVPRELPEDPGADFDHMSVVRRLTAWDRTDARDRIRGAEVLEKRRQYDLDKGINAGAKNLRLEDWLAMTLADVPKEARPRLFGLLAEEMANARTPWLAMPETTEAQIAVWHQLGLEVPAEEAEELMGLLAPGRAMAMARAAELALERAGPPPDASPVDPEDYLDVPRGAGGS